MLAILELGLADAPPAPRAQASHTGRMSAQHMRRMGTAYARTQARRESGWGSAMGKAALGGAGEDKMRFLGLSIG